VPIDITGTIRGSKGTKESNDARGDVTVEEKKKEKKKKKTFFFPSFFH